MPIVVECPSCEGRFRAKDALKGKELPCPKCKETLAVDGPWISPFDVFLSHSSKDSDIANAVCHALEEKGVRCWIAPRDIPAGQKWAESIVQGISDCSIMILLVSDDSVLSQQVMNELEQAVSQNLKILPVKIEEVELTSEMSYFLSRTHWLDAFPDPINAYLDKLTRDVRKLLSGDSGPSVAPPGESLAEESSRIGRVFRTIKRVTLLSALCVGIFYAWPWLIQIPEFVEKLSQSTKVEEGIAEETPKETIDIENSVSNVPEEASDTTTIVKIDELNESPPTQEETVTSEQNLNNKPNLWSLIRKFKEHNHFVTAIQFDSSGKMMLSASYDGTMKLLDLETGTVLQNFQFEKSSDPRGVSAVYYDADFTPDDEMIISIHDGQVRIWNPNEPNATDVIDFKDLGTHNLTTLNHTSEVVLNLGDSLLVMDSQYPIERRILDDRGYGITDLISIPGTWQIATINSIPSLQLWDLKSDQIVRTISVPERAGFQCVAASHDGTMIAAGGTMSVMIWNLKDGQPQISLTPYSSRTTSMQVTSIAFSPNDHYLVAGNQAGEAHVWNLETEELFQVIDGQGIVGPGGQVRVVSLSPDGKILALGRTNGQVELYRTAEPLHGRATTIVPLTKPKPGKDVVTNPDMKKPGSVEKWGLIRTLHEQGNDINALEFSPDDVSLLSASRDGTLKLYEVSTGFVQTTLSTSEDDPLKGMPFWDATSPSDGSIIASLHDHRIQLWYPGDELTSKNIEYADAIGGLDFNSDGRLIAVGGRDEVMLFDTKDTENVRRLSNASGQIWDLAFLPGDRQLVTNSLGKVLQLWDLKSGQILKTFPIADRNGSSQLSVSEDGKRLAAAGPQNVYLWNLESGELECQLKSEKEIKPLSLIFSPHTPHLLVGYDSGEILVWDLSRRVVLQTLESTTTENDRDVMRLALNHQGTILAVGRGDGRVDLFQPPSTFQNESTEQLTPAHDEQFGTVDFTQVKAGRKPVGWKGSTQIAVNFNGGAPGFQPVPETLTKLETVSYNDLNLSGNFFVELQLRATNQESITLDLLANEGGDSIELVLENEQNGGWAITPKSEPKVKEFKDWHESVDQGTWLRLEHVIENGKPLVYASVDGRLQEQKPLTTGTLAKFDEIRLGFPRGPNTRKIQNLRWGPLRDELLLQTLDFAPPLPAGGRKLPLGWEILAGIVGEQKPQRLVARELSMGDNFQVEWEVKVENDDGRFSLNLLGHHGGPTLPVHFHFTKVPGRGILNANLSGVKKTWECPRGDHRFQLRRTKGELILNINGMEDELVVPDTSLGAFSAIEFDVLENGDFRKNETSFKYTLPRIMAIKPK